MSYIRLSWCFEYCSNSNNNIDKNTINVARKREGEKRGPFFDQTCVRARCVAPALDYKVSCVYMYYIHIYNAGGRVDAGGAGPTLSW